MSLHIYSSQVFKFEKLTIMTKMLTQSAVSHHLGHGAVMRSLLAGLERLKVPYNFDPSIDKVGDVLLVTTQFDGEAIQQALLLKRKGCVKKLLFGPNFFPKNANHPELDVFLVASEPMIRDCQKKEPELGLRCRVWPSGVDPDFWEVKDTDKQKNSNKVLIYVKRNNMYDSVAKIVEKYGWRPIKIIYKPVPTRREIKYKMHEYKHLLSECRFAIFLSSSETQGIALLEAWASDVPTFPWNPKDTVQGSCPYLNAQLGRDWKNLSELENLLRSMDKLLSRCSPRKWVLENMTDEISVKILVGIINDCFCDEN